MSYASGKKKARFAGVDRHASETQGAEGLSIVGVHCDIHDDPELARLLHREEHLQPWPGDPDVLVDRFDARLLLDSPLTLTQTSRGPQPHIIEHAESEEEVEVERWCDLNDADESQLERPYATAPPATPALSAGPGERDKGGGGPAGSHAVQVRYGSPIDSAGGGYHVVGFSYDQPACEPSSSGAPAAAASPEQTLRPSPKEAEEKLFRPWFELPENLGGRVPLTQRHHKIIAQTAKFVRAAGHQSEFVLRVKHAANPNFGFLLPQDQLHDYFRWLVKQAPQEVFENPPEEQAEEGAGQAPAAATSLGAAGPKQQEPSSSPSDSGLGALGLLSMYGSTEISSGSSREDLPVITQQASPSQQQEQSHELGNGSLREPAGTDAFPGEDLEDRDPGPRETDPDKGESLPAASAPSAPLPDGRMREGQLDNDLGTNNGLVASGTPAPVSSSTFEPVACSTFPHFSSSAPLPIASSAAPTSATKAASLFPIGPQTPAGPSAQFPGAAAGPTVPAARSAAALFPVDALGPSQGTASSSMDWIPSKVPPPASTLVGASGVGNARSFPGFPLPSAERPAGVSTSNPASGTGGTGGAADRPPGRDSGPAGGQESDRTHAAAESGDYSDPSGGRGERDRDDYGRQATPLGRGGDVEMEEAGRNARERGAGQLEQLQGSSGEAVDGRAGGNAASEGPRGPGRPGNVPPRDIQAIIEKLVAFVKKAGPRFELAVLQKESKNKKFAFLRGDNKFHAYYRDKLREALGPEGMEEVFRLRPPPPQPLHKPPPQPLHQPTPQPVHQPPPDAQNLQAAAQGPQPRPQAQPAPPAPLLEAQQPSDAPPQGRLSASHPTVEGPREAAVSAVIAAEGRPLGDGAGGGEAQASAHVTPARATGAARGRDPLEAPPGTGHRDSEGAGADPHSASLPVPSGPGGTRILTAPRDGQHMGPASDDDEELPFADVDEGGRTAGAAAKDFRRPVRIDPGEELPFADVDEDGRAARAAAKHSLRPVTIDSDEELPFADVDEDGRAAGASAKHSRRPVNADSDEELPFAGGPDEELAFAGEDAAEKRRHVNENVREAVPSSGDREELPFAEDSGDARRSGAVKSQRKGAVQASSAALQGVGDAQTLHVAVRAPSGVPPEVDVQAGTPDGWTAPHVWAGTAGAAREGEAGASSGEETADAPYSPTGYHSGTEARGPEELGEGPGGELGLGDGAEESRIDWTVQDQDAAAPNEATPGITGDKQPLLLLKLGSGVPRNRILTQNALEVAGGGETGGPKAAGPRSGPEGGAGPPGDTGAARAPGGPSSVLLKANRTVVPVPNSRTVEEASPQRNSPEDSAGGGSAEEGEEEEGGDEEGTVGKGRSLARSESGKEDLFDSDEEVGGSRRAERGGAMPPEEDEAVKAERRRRARELLLKRTMAGGRPDPEPGSSSALAARVPVPRPVALLRKALLEEEQETWEAETPAEPGEIVEATPDAAPRQQQVPVKGPVLPSLEDIMRARAGIKVVSAREQSPLSTSSQSSGGSRSMSEKARHKRRRKEKSGKDASRRRGPSPRRARTTHQKDPRESRRRDRSSSGSPDRFRRRSPERDARHKGKSRATHRSGRSVSRSPPREASRRPGRDRRNRSRSVSSSPDRGRPKKAKAERSKPKEAKAAGREGHKEKRKRAREVSPEGTGRGATRTSTRPTGLQPEEVPDDLRSKIRAMLASV